MPVLFFLAGGGLLIGGFALLASILRRRDDLGVLEGDDVLELAAAACDSAGAGLTDAELAVAIAIAVDPKGTYPPPFFSSMQERVFFQQIAGWVADLRTVAGAGKDLCEHIAEIGEIPVLPPPEDFEPLPSAQTPTPGLWYRIRAGDNLFKITGQAYGVGPGQERYRLAKLVNDAAANLPYRISTAGTQNENLFPDGLISFFPRWSSVPTQAGRTQSGSSFALILFPDETQEASFGG